MKIAICLFVFCAALLLADFVESKQKDDTNIKAILNHLNKITMLKKRRAIKSVKEAKSKMMKTANVGHKDISKLIKSSITPYGDLKKKALEAQNITIASSELILDLVNKTVDGLRTSLRDACITIKDLKKVYFDQVTKYGNKCLLKINNAIKKDKLDDAKEVYKLQLRLISKISESSTLRLTDVVTTSSKLVSDLAESGRVLMLDTAEKQVKKLEPLYSNNARLEQFIDFASEKIYSLAEQSGDKYVALVNDALKRLKGLVSKCEKALTDFTDAEIQKGNATIHNQEIYIIQKEEAEKKLDKEFLDLMSSIQKNSEKIMKDAVTTVSAIKGCKANKQKCEVTKLSPPDGIADTKVPATLEPEAEAPATEEPEDEAPATEAPATEKPATEEPEDEPQETEKPEANEQETEKPATEEPEDEPQETEKPEAKAPETEEPATKEPGNKEPVSKEISSEEQKLVPDKKVPISKVTSSEENTAGSEET